MVTNDFYVIDLDAQELHQRVLHTRSLESALLLTNFWNSLTKKFKYILGEPRYPDIRPKLDKIEEKIWPSIEYCLNGTFNS